MTNYHLEETRQTDGHFIGITQMSTLFSVDTTFL